MKGQKQQEETDESKDQSLYQKISKESDSFFQKADKLLSKIGL